MHPGLSRDRQATEDNNLGSQVSLPEIFYYLTILKGDDIRNKVNKVTPLK